MSQEIQLYSRIQNPIEAIQQMGTFFAKSGMFGCDRVEQGHVLAMACMAEQKSPLHIKRKYHLQNGELSMRADAMLADFRAVAGGKHKILERSEKRAAVELALDGNSHVFEFSWEEALKEPFVYGKENKIKKNYATPRARTQMLWARVISDAVRTMAPEIVSGTYTPEELGDDTSESPSKQLLPVTKTEIEIKPAKVNGVETISTPTTDPNSTTAAGEPAATVNNWASAKDPKVISIEAAAALMEIIPAEAQGIAMKWFEAQKWIPPMGGILDLSPARAKKIYDAPEKFLKHIGAN